MVRVLDSPTCWGCGAKNPNKFGTPICHPRKLPKTQPKEGNKVNVAVGGSGMMVFCIVFTAGINLD